MNMKKVLCILMSVMMLMSCFVMNVSAKGSTFYIDSMGGSDSASGLSERSAWKTVENLRKAKITAGDKILFRCGGVYTSDCLTLTVSGTQSAPIEISSYGEGDKPLLTTAEKTEVLRLIDCSCVKISNLEITAHNGGGIWINTKNAESDKISLDNLTIHDIQNFKVTGRDSQANPTAGRACIVVKSLSYPSSSLYRVNNLTVTNCEMYDCGNGLLLWGAFTPDSKSPWSDNPTDDPTIIYNQNALVENCYFHDMDAEGMIIGQTENALVNDCRFINCCQGEAKTEDGKSMYCTAPVWYWGGLNSTVQNCEVSGSKNFGDGMACDFDSWTDNCTYQYIYSHDNTRFVCLCPYGTGQHSNTIRYCLSVNDNVGRNSIGGSGGEYELKFYNNTIVNCSGFSMNQTYDSYFVNNIITGNCTCDFYWTRKNVDDATGEKVIHEFSGTFSNNCLWGTCVPIVAENNFICSPRFAGTDETNPESFKLAENSRLIGKGIDMEDGVKTDFFGNEIESINIGCYGGSGEGKAPVRFFDSIFRLLNSLIGRLVQVITDLSNRYWLF